MDTTIADQARLWAGVLSGEGLSPASRAERLYSDLARVVLGESDMPWYWEYGWYEAEP